MLKELLVGVPVSEEELSETQLHLESCPRCATRYGGEPPGALGSAEKTAPGAPGSAAAPALLFERALIAALSADETIVRARAAEQLADVSEPGFEVIRKLRTVATRDRDKRVSKSAKAALERLLERGATLRLEPAAVQGEPVLNLGGDDISGRVSVEGGELWLRLSSLPPEYDQTRPLVYLPAASKQDIPAIEWRGGESGLVQADEAVIEGEVEIHLGRLREYKAERTEAPRRPPEAPFKLVRLLPLRDL